MNIESQIVAELIGSLILLSALVAAGLIEFYQQRTGVSPMPTMPWVRRAMLQLVQSPQADVIYELGCGWGGMAFALARRFPQHQVKAYELSLLPWLVCCIRQVFCRLPNLQIIRQDFFTASLADAGTVLCYLWPAGMQRLAEKLEHECQPSTAVISSNFPVNRWKPYAVQKFTRPWTMTLYAYKVGQNVV